MSPLSENGYIFISKMLFPTLYEDYKNYNIYGLGLGTITTICLDKIQNCCSTLLWICMISYTLCIMSEPWENDKKTQNGVRQFSARKTANHFNLTIQSTYMNLDVFTLGIVYHPLYILCTIGMVGIDVRVGLIIYENLSTTSSQKPTKTA